MTEEEWLKSKNTEAMLALFAGREPSARRWRLLSAAFARRAADLLPEGPYRAAVEWFEQNASVGGKYPQAKLLDPANGPAEVARAAQRAIVLAADPDTDPDEFTRSDPRQVNPAAPLFQSACRAAGHSIEHAVDAVSHIHEAVNALFQMPPGPELIEAVRKSHSSAAWVRASASLYAAMALKLKSLGDEAADGGTVKNVRIRYSAALQTAQKEEESTGTKYSDLEEQKQKADRKALGRFLHDLIGNPFKPYRFEKSWRTPAVLELAKAIECERAFDRMPQLADALLDADCDEEAVLRHCRGTEIHCPDGPLHIRGCWVLDLILEREPAFFTRPAAEAPKPKPVPSAAKKPVKAGGGLAGLLDALRRGEKLDDDE